MQQNTLDKQLTWTQKLLHVRRAALWLR